MVSSIIVYWRDKKRLYAMFGVSIISVLFMVGTFVLVPSQSNKRDESVDQIKITTEYINLRTKSSREGKIVGLVYEGEIYTVLDVAEEKDYTWYKICTSNGKTGYVASGYSYVEYIEAK